MSTAITINKHVLITPPTFKKVEHKAVGNLVLPTQKFELLEVELLMGYHFEGKFVPAGSKLFLRGDAGLAPWAKNTLTVLGKEAVLCPDSNILAYEIKE